ncbi:hypothetical protein [Paraburkholderia sp.]|uniref:hypothetical protein n=1 Tax=Paraburkholderia sp. TaxID=1926495 RepID=UPI003C7ABDDB
MEHNQDESPDLSIAGIDADHCGIVRMTQQITRGANPAPTLVAGGRAGQPCGQPAPALNTANHEQENGHVPN